MTNALIVVDVQESFRQRASWAESSNPEIVQQVNRLVAHARDRGDFVVWVLHQEPGTGGVFDPAQGHVRLMDPLVARDGEPLLYKTSHNSFTTTNLQQLLTERGVRRLTVCGVRTEQCAETTARIASDLGFEVDFAIDATATEPIKHRDGHTILSTKDILERTEYVLHQRFANVTTVEELTAR